MDKDEPSDCLSELPTRPSHLKLMRVRHACSVPVRRCCRPKQFSPIVRPNFFGLPGVGFTQGMPKRDSRVVQGCLVRSPSSMQDVSTPLAHVRTLDQACSLRSRHMLQRTY